MPTDPFPLVADVIGEPYANAFEVDVEALLTGDIEPPVVSSAVWMTAGRLTVTMQGGQVVTLRSNVPALLKVRIMRVHQADPEDDHRPYSALILW